MNQLALCMYADSDSLLRLVATAISDQQIDTKEKSAQVGARMISMQTGEMLACYTSAYDKGYISTDAFLELLWAPLLRLGGKIYQADLDQPAGDVSTSQLQLREKFFQTWAISLVITLMGEREVDHNGIRRCINLLTAKKHACLVQALLKADCAKVWHLVFSAYALRKSV